MVCSILTEQRWSQLLEGRLSKEEKALIYDHLEVDCPDCEYIFERMSDDEELRFREIFNQKAAQLHVAAAYGDSGRNPASKPESNSSVKRGFLSALFGGNYPAPAWAGGVAVVLLVVTGVITQFMGVNEPRHQQFEKGIPGDKSASINLQFAIGHSLENKGSLAINRGTLGERVRASDRLFMHYDLSADGYTYIFGYEPGKEASLIYPDKPGQAVSKAAGSYDIMDRNQVNGMPLSGVNGRYMVVGVYSPTAVDRPDKMISVIQKAVDARTGAADKAIINSVYKDVAVSVVYFDVAE